MYKLKKSIIIFFFALMPTLVSAITPDQKAIKNEMIQNLDVLKNIFQSKYAPAEWKKNYAGWDLESEIEKTKDSIKNRDDITLKEYQGLVRDFFNSTQDYHTKVVFYSTAMALLPFQFKSAENRYFITRVLADDFKNTLRVGDEVIAINGIPIQTAVEDFRNEIYSNSDSPTDQALAEMYFTLRVGFLGHPLPQSPEVVLEVKRKKDGATTTFEMVWASAPEEIPDGPFSIMNIKHAAMISKKDNSSLSDLKYFNKKMVPGFYEPLKNAVKNLTCYNIDQQEDFLILGSRKSFLPKLGTVSWETDNGNPFHAYLFKTPKNQTIGYVRISGYSGSEAMAKKFAEIIKHFQTHSDALIIDQLNNPGGSVMYLYALASMLSPHPLHLPTHRMTINQFDVVLANKALEELKKIPVTKDRGLDTIEGYPATKQLVEATLNYHRIILSEWNAGRSFTTPQYLFGIEKLTTHPWACYKKPILMLVNQLDFSGGDFLPAILQDNKRVTIMGMRTAGAGGYVESHKYPNRLGIDEFQYTASIAQRLDESPIENLGVTPDIPYELTAKDLKSNYADYVEAIHKAIEKILKK